MVEGDEAGEEGEDDEEEEGQGGGAGGRGGDRSDDGAVFSDDDLWSEGDDEGDDGRAWKSVYSLKGNEGDELDVENR